MARRPLVFEITANVTNFRIADTRPPLEEVSETGGGKIGATPIRMLYTVKVTPGPRVDRIAGNGILYAKGSRAPYRIRGVAGGGPSFSERVRGMWMFGPDCTGSLRELRNAKASFRTDVDAKGRSKTTVSIERDALKP